LHFVGFSFFFARIMAIPTSKKHEQIVLAAIASSRSDDNHQNPFSCCTSESDANISRADSLFDQKRVTMTIACKDYYERLHASSAAVLTESFNGGYADAMAKSHAFIADLALWTDELKARREVSVLNSALKEYQFALLALSAGYYRAAFSALRLTLELSFAGVGWSANERELREWQLGQRDSNWQALSDSENGVLSKQFVQLFSEGLADDAPKYRSAAIAVYRECSEYVHGNAQTHRSIPEVLIFDGTLFDTWQQKASVVQLTVSFALAARYLSDLDANARSRLESMLLDRLGHLAGIRVLLGATTEGPNA
jgi:hypothetical protein